MKPPFQAGAGKGASWIRATVAGRFLVLPLPALLASCLEPAPFRARQQAASAYRGLHAGCSPPAPCCRPLKTPAFAFRFRAGGCGAEVTTRIGVLARSTWISQNRRPVGSTAQRGKARRVVIAANPGPEGEARARLRGIAAPPAASNASTRLPVAGPAGRLPIPLIPRPAAERGGRLAGANLHQGCGRGDLRRAARPAPAPAASPSPSGPSTERHRPRPLLSSRALRSAPGPAPAKNDDSLAPSLEGGRPPCGGGKAAPAAVSRSRGAPTFGPQRRPPCHRGHGFRGKPSA